MPESPLLTAGAQIEPSSAAPLHTNEFFTGMWTQGNPLGPGAVPYLYQKFYSASRYDRLVGGKNMEVTSKLTLGRRPGHTVYNEGPFPPINRFYEFRAFQNQAEIIHLMASCDAAPGSVQGSVREVTAGSNLDIWDKNHAAGRTGFQSVGNLLFFSDGVDAKKWVTSGKTWGATVVLNIASLELVTINPRTPSEQILLRVTFTAPVPAIVPNTLVTFAGLTTNTILNGQQLVYQSWAGYTTSSQLAFANYPTGSYTNGADTGTVTVSFTSFQPGDFIIDSNNNIQTSMGSQTANVVNIQVEFILGGDKVVTLFLDPSTPLNILDGISLTLAGLTTVPTLNGATPHDAFVLSTTQVAFRGVFFGVPVTAFSTETGTATTGTGITGPTTPVWNPGIDVVTQDGTLQWINLGPSVQNWGFPAPVAAPTVTQVAAPSIYPAWAANTWYAPAFVIDSGGVLFKLTTAGTTGGSLPSFNTSLGATTADNTCVWTSLGPGTWAPSTVYAAGVTIVATFTYYITTQEIQYGWTGTGFGFHTVTVTVPITATNTFVCATGGTSGAVTPSWTNGLGTTVTDNTVVWTNTGVPQPWPGAAQILSLATKVLDSNGNVQQAQIFGESGGTAPTWNTTQGATTSDHFQAWLNQGPYSAANTAAWQWAFSGKNSVTGHIGTASPVSLPLVVAAGQLPVIQGVAPSDIQEDVIVLWRTVQGGSVLMYDDEFPNPGAGSTWIYTDTNNDPSSTASPQKGQLNFLITAPINNTNDPPPAGFIPQAYYLGRIWGYVGNQLRWSGGPATITGSGNEAFPPLNQTTFPSAGVTCWATSVGLICYTNSDVWVVLGQGTASSPFYVVNFQQGVGLAAQDAFAVNGSTSYGILTSGQVVSMDPGAGELEVGFPIGDQFNEIYTASNAYCAWHQGSSADTALYVADGSMGWFRMAAVAAPENGNVWSNRALIEGGVKAIASLEIQPGLRRLLLGPAVAGPILMRDLTVNSDNGTAYEAFADIGSIQMAQPGTTVGVQYLVTEELAIAGSSAAYIAVLFDEISSDFTTLRNRSNDPPNLPTSESITVGRWWTSQDAGTVPICRHMKVRIGWPAEDHPNELLTYTIFGKLPQKARK